ncbi:MAG: RNA 2',3'-cyclic phosphodiesterase [Candidatus Portnoybacteria bacterium]
MKRRIFVAVNLPEAVKNKLSGYGEKWPELPAKWTKKDNLHITLAFLGYVAEDDLMAVLKEVKNITSEIQPFSITLNQVIYAPPGKSPPRMIWAEGKESILLGKLQKELGEALLNVNPKGLRPYSPHITLARIKPWQFKTMEPEERPEIKEEINISFDVESIEVMESCLKRGGPDYAVLESFSLKDQ